MTIFSNSLSYHNPETYLKWSRSTTDSKDLLPLEEAFRKCTSYEEAREMLLSDAISYFDERSREALLNFISHCDFSGETLLMRSFTEGDQVLAKKLLELGVDPNGTNKSGQSAFAYIRDFTLFEQLVKNNYEPDMKSINEIVSSFLRNYQRTVEFDKELTEIVYWIFKKNLSTSFFEELSEGIKFHLYGLFENKNLRSYDFAMLFIERGFFFLSYQGEGVTKTVFREVLKINSELFSQLIEEGTFKSAEEQIHLLKLITQGDFFANTNTDNLLALSKPIVNTDLFKDLRGMGCSEPETIILWVLFQEKDPDRLANILCNLFNTTNIASSKSLRSKIVDHINEACEKEGNNFWSYFLKYYHPWLFHIEKIFELGFCPNAKDSLGRHVPLLAIDHEGGYKEPYDFLMCLEYFPDIQWDHRNKSGYNVLEYFIKIQSHITNSRDHYLMETLKLLISKGISFEKSNPHFELAKSVTDEFLLQIVIMLFMDVNDSTYRENLLNLLTMDEFTNLVWAIMKDQMLFKNIMPSILDVAKNGGGMLNYISKRGITDSFSSAVVGMVHADSETIKSIPFIDELYPLLPYVINTSTFTSLIKEEISTVEALKKSFVDVIQRHEFLLNESQRKGVVTTFCRKEGAEIEFTEFLKHQQGIKAESLKSDRPNTYYMMSISWEGISTIPELGTLTSTPVLLLICNALFSNFSNPEKQPLLGLDEVTKCFEECSSVEVKKLFSFLSDNPKFMKYISKHYLFCDELVIGQFGKNSNSYSAFFTPLLSKLNTKGLSQQDKQLEEDFRRPSIPVATTMHKAEGTFIETMGRTLIFNPKNDEGTLNAYKILKAGEPLSEFCTEDRVTRTFRKMASEGFFCSEFHEPQGVFMVRDLDLPVKDAKLDRMKHGNFWYIYHYKAKPEYFRYLHDSESIKEEPFTQGRKRFLADTIKRINMGIYPIVADMYHNEASERKYLPLRDLVNQSGYGNSNGAGRLHAWIQCILYPNARENGAADMGDAHFLRDLIRDPKIISSDFGEIKEPVARLHVNALSQMMLVDMLILAYRRKKQELTDWTSPEQVKSFAKDLFEGLATILETSTAKSSSDCRKFLLECGVNWTRAAKQIMFWIEPHGENGYINWVLRDCVPPGLYSKKTNVTVTAKKAPNFTTEKGFSTNGEIQDIGAFNGPLALTEMEKAWAIISLFAVSTVTLTS